MSTTPPTKEQLLRQGLSPLWRPYHQNERHGLHLPGNQHVVHVFGAGDQWRIEVRSGSKVVGEHEMACEGPHPFEAMKWAQELRESIEDPGMPEEFDQGWKHS